MCINDDGLRSRSPRPATEQGALLGEHVGGGPAVVARPVVVVVEHGPGHHVAQRDPLPVPGLQSGQVVDQVIDHLHVPVVVLWL